MGRESVRMAPLHAPKNKFSIYHPPREDNLSVKDVLKYFDQLEYDNNRLKEILRDLSIRHEQRFDESVCDCAEHRVARKYLEDNK